MKKKLLIRPWFHPSIHVYLGTREESDLVFSHLVPVFLARRLFSSSFLVVTHQVSFPRAPGAVEDIGERPKNKKNKNPNEKFGIFREKLITAAQVVVGEKVKSWISESVILFFFFCSGESIDDVSSILIPRIQLICDYILWLRSFTSPRRSPCK